MLGQFKRVGWGGEGEALMLRGVGRWGRPCGEGRTGASLVCPMVHTVFSQHFLESGAEGKQAQVYFGDVGEDWV